MHHLSARNASASKNSVASPMRHRILVVDDNRDAAVTLAMMLRIMGHDTQTAHDGVDAVQAAARFQPDVVLLDIGLPKLNGYEVCRRIRGQPHGGEIAVIALTGWGRDEDRCQSAEAGFDFHLVKPVSVDTLGQLLSALAPTER
jgi:CheY-like chemotaxis protein